MNEHGNCPLLIGIGAIAIGLVMVALVACPSDGDEGSEGGDRDAPTFTIEPMNGDIDVATNANIVIRASEPIRRSDGATIDNSDLSGMDGLITLTETPRDGSAADKPFTATIDGTLITINPESDFTVRSSVSVTMAQVEDLTGNDSDDPALSASFAIVTVDMQAPTFTIEPMDGDIDVATNANIVIRASEPIRRSDGATIDNSDLSGMDGLITLTETPRDGSAADKPFTATIDGTLITINPESDFTARSSVSVTLAQVEDLTGNDSDDPALSASFAIVTVDMQAPTFTIEPMDGEDISVFVTIVIRASEAIRMTDDTAIDNSNVGDLITLTETRDGSAIDKTPRVTIDGVVITITPNSAFTTGATVSVTMAQVEDLAGNASDDPALSASFRIVESQMVTFTVMPADGATNVLPNATIVINASEPIRDVGGAPLTFANLYHHIDVKEQGPDDEFARFRAYTATINRTRTEIFITPNVAFNVGSLVEVTLDRVEYSGGRTTEQPALRTSFAVSISLFDFQPTASTIVEEGGEATLTLTLNRAAGESAVRIPYTIAGNGITVADLSSHSALSGEVVIPASRRTGTIQITAMQDSDEENDETLTVTLTPPDAGANWNGVIFAAGDDYTTATVTIADDDDLGATMSMLDAELDENSSGGEIIRVNLESVPAGHGAATITYSLSGSATLGAHWTGAIVGDATLTPLSSASGSFTIPEQTIANRLDGTTDGSETTPHFILSADPIDDSLFNENREIVFTIESLNYAGTTANPDVAGSAIINNGQSVTIVNDDNQLTIGSVAKIAHELGNGPTLANIDQFGASVAWLGDLDGAGGAAGVVAVGAEKDDTADANDPRRNDEGAVYLLFLNSDGSVRSGDTVKIDDTSTILSDLLPRDFFGRSVAWLGDLDGVGGAVGVLSVGSNDESGRGAAHLLFLDADGSLRSTRRILHNTNIGPDLSRGDQFGRSIAWLGDLDGAGGTAGVLAVGDPFENGTGSSSSSRNFGAVYLLFLSANGSVYSTVKIAHNQTGGPALRQDDFFGSSLAWLGDLNGSFGAVGVLAVGVTGDNTGGPERGAIYLLFLDSDGSVLRRVKIDDHTSRGPNLSNQDRFGSSVAWLGDVDGTGGTAGVLAVGAETDDGSGTERGAVYLIYLNANGNVVNTLKIDDATTDSLTLIDYSRFGASVAWLGDLDETDDGIGTLMVGANWDSTRGDRRGAVYLIELQ